MDAKHRVVIVGGGFGGLYTAQALAQGPGRGDADRPPQFPPLPAAALSGGDRRPVAGQHRLAAARPAQPAAQRPRPHGRGRRLRPRPAAWSHFTDAGMATRPSPYDSLIVATGARHHYFNHPEWEKDAPGLKTIEDATDMRRRILYAFEAAELTPDPKDPRGVADVRRRRRRADRRGAGRGRRRSGPPHAAPRLPLHPADARPHPAARRGRPRPRRLRPEPVAQGGRGAGPARRHGANRGRRDRREAGSGDGPPRRPHRGHPDADGAVGGRRRCVAAWADAGDGDRRRDGSRRPRGRAAGPELAGPAGGVRDRRPGQLPAPDRQAAAGRGARWPCSRGDTSPT